MPYEPTNWKSGDVVTSAKLNKLEQAVAGCSLVVHTTTEGDDDTGYVTTMDKTWQEIFDAFSTGASVVVVIGETEAYNVTLASIEDGEVYVVKANKSYITDSASGYPAIEGGR